jgi:hypothetical protein
MLVPDLAFSKYNIVELRSGERRLLYLLGQSKKLLLHRSTGRVNGGTNR